MKEDEKEKKEQSATTEPVPQKEEDKDPSVSKSPDNEDEEIDVEDFTEGFFVDSTLENSEEKVRELQEQADTLSGIKKAHDVRTLHLPYVDVQTDEGYAYKASTKGMDEEAAATKETDLVRSYFLSDAFKNRVVKSLGYENLEDMSEDDRKVYNDIVTRGKELSVNLRVGFIDRDMRDDVHSCCLSDNGVTTVLINPNDGGLGMSILAHELAHHLYSKDNINPGKYDVEQEYGGCEKRYGKPDSPLNTINSSDVNERRARAIYQGFFEHLSEFVHLDKKDLSDKLNDYLKEGTYKEHDNAGMERAADVHGVRLLMMQEGIWNPFTGDDVTVDQIRKFRKAHPESRIFEYWNNKEAAYYLNHIAMSDKIKPDGLRLDCSRDGQYRCVASVGGTEIVRPIDERQYYKLLALDDQKRSVLLSQVFGSKMFSFDFGEKVLVSDLMDASHQSIQGVEIANAASIQQSEKTPMNYRVLASANFDSISNDISDSENMERHQGMSV